MAFKDLPKEEQRRIKEERRAYKERQKKRLQVRNTKKLNKVLKERGEDVVMPLMKGRHKTGQLLLRRERAAKGVAETSLPVWLRAHAPLSQRLSAFVKAFLVWDLRQGALAINPNIPREELPEKLYWNFTNVIGKTIAIPPYEYGEKLSRDQVLCFLRTGAIPDRFTPDGEAVFLRWTDPQCKYYNRVEQGRKFAQSWIDEIERFRKIPFWIKASVSDWTYRREGLRNSIKLFYRLGDPSVYSTLKYELRFPVSERCDLSCCDPIEILRAYQKLCEKREEVVRYLARSGLYELKGVRANYLTQKDDVDWRAGALTDDKLREWVSLYPNKEKREWLMSFVS